MRGLLAGARGMRPERGLLEVALAAAAAWLALGAACGQRERPPASAEGSGGSGAAARAERAYAEARARLVEGHIAPAIRDARVLAAMRKVPRHLFVPPEYRDAAYEDRPLPIGHGQTISQPYIVALMTELLHLGPESRVLEIGTGSGYQAAVLAEVAGEVYSIEILEDVAASGARNLERAGYRGLHLRVGDGYLGWPEAAPFDGIIVTCAPEHIPRPLQEQLAEGGRLVIPVGERGEQELVVVTKEGGELHRTEVIPVRFVPMTGIAEGREGSGRRAREGAEN